MANNNNNNSGGNKDCSIVVAGVRFPAKELGTCAMVDNGIQPGLASSLFYASVRIFENVTSHSNFLLLFPFLSLTLFVHFLFAKLVGCYTCSLPLTL